MGRPAFSQVLEGVREAWALRRAEIPHYVQQELFPALLEAFHAQREDWGFG